MLKILIIEDEEPATNRLMKMIKEVEPQTELLAAVESVSTAIKWFKENPMPDLLFSDIQLGDGTSFDIFREVTVTCPIIFTTAFDQYAIEAFKVNSIDYLLKPLKKEDLSAALAKFKNNRQPGNVFDISKLLESYNSKPAAFKTRFIVRYGDHIKTIQTNEIAYFYTEDKVTFLTTFEGRRFAIDFNLDSLESQLEPKSFFRINRQFLISINSISEMFAYTKSRVLIKLKPAAKQETIVSTERSSDFKTWLDDGG